VGEACDVAVVGGGIVGLAVARALALARPRLRLVVLERESDVATAQTGHNSGVVHSGLYYRPGSLKARLCVEGGRELKRYCERHGIACPEVGKVVVAVEASELDRLEALWQRGVANGVADLRRLDARALADVEPAAGGLAAIHSPHTAIVDYRQVAAALVADLIAAGARVVTGAAVRAATRDGARVRLRADPLELDAGYVVNCAGLEADRVARLLGARPTVRIVPFRGEYRLLAPAAAARVRGLIYPVPDPTLPFLGVHLTRTVDGRVEAGPNAVWTLSRRGYRRGLPPLRDAWEALSFPGLWRLGRRHLATAVFEYRRSLSSRLFAASVRRLMPALADVDLVAGGAGVRAQAVAPTGELVDDFVIVQDARSLSVLNAPSPAATASLAIGRFVAGRVLEALSERG
jgi:L-2-hydroxyglutarate oxidase